MSNAKLGRLATSERLHLAPWLAREIADALGRDVRELFPDNP